MPGSSRKVPAWLPILVILIAMISIQSGASLAKSLFPLVGAPGVTALRLALGTFILVVIFKPWRLRFAPEQRLPLLFYGLSLGAMNYLFYLSIQRIPLGVAVALEFTGPLAVAQIDPIGALLALGAGACWAVYILTGQRAGEEHGPATVAMGSLIAAVVFVPMGMIQASDTLFQWGLLLPGLGIAILSTALPYSLEMVALTRMPSKTFGTLMSMEPALAALSGMVFLGETLTATQTLALGAIILASMGSTLTMRRETKIQKVDIS